MQEKSCSIIIESDSVSVVNRFREKHEDITTIDFYVIEIKEMALSIPDVVFSWCASDSYKTAKKLSEIAFNKQYYSLFEMDYPSNIHQLVISDSS